jgi:signal transduction histidine kinase
MSHELRTPLNAILGFTGTLLMGLHGPLTDEQIAPLRTVQRTGKHLLSLINAFQRGCGGCRNLAQYANVSRIDARALNRLSGPIVLASPPVCGIAL